MVVRLRGDVRVEKNGWVGRWFCNFCWLACLMKARAPLIQLSGVGWAGVRFEIGICT